MTLYLWFKAFHLISLISWFAGLFYLPRLFVYYAESGRPEVRETLLIMQVKLWKIIMVPASLLTALFGFALIMTGWLHRGLPIWLVLKGLLLLVLYAYHGYLGAVLGTFRKGVPPRSGTYYRVLNEIPTVLLIAIVSLAVLKP